MVVKYIVSGVGSEYIDLYWSHLPTFLNCASHHVHRARLRYLVIEETRKLELYSPKNVQLKEDMLRYFRVQSKSFLGLHHRVML